MRATPEWLQAYRTLSGGPENGVLPVLAPQILAGPLHAQVLCDPQMPVGVLGLVHVVNRVEQHHPIADDQPFDLEVWIEGHRAAKQGAELDVHTRASVDGEVVWTAVTTALSRGKWKDPTAPGAPAEDAPLPQSQAHWRVAEDIGRRWRRVSGDPNPIHLHAWLAKPFGFRRAIAHGTWLLAHAAGLLGESDGPALLEARFRRPVFLPATVEFRTDADGRFELRDAKRDRRHLEGRLTASSP